MKWIILSSCLLCFPVFAGPVDSMYDFLKNTTSISADFVQFYDDKRIKEGHVIIQRLVGFRWAYSNPRQIYVGFRNTLSFYDESLMQIIKHHVMNWDAFPLSIVLNPSRISRFRLTSLSSGGNVDFIRLVPKGFSSSSISYITVGLVKGEPCYWDIFDATHHHTTLDFYNIVINQPVSEKVFSIVATSGIDVIDVSRSSAVGSF
ncbi:MULTISPECIES: LolA family protein [Candidatus Ichthyocystis]|uniref:Putative outer membrane lipoprotein carrier protein LolA n=1 Tax=Candidatus Ichthyocystis hellenicum TaxID=1561003 RepID=A0A0S4M1S5_9BURK|nr:MULTISPECIES: outer membrane lipoprotein carrier protein LolA [Ichthyocystis]CUT17721.1 putative outer membrane lipoprotein carrier protein LolA [Candidatus Ichthyocystis hellenicum]